jgi:hypothetical protein|tara:strand:- start:565 stop:804 length:240 start_codon:yes stop_codon:yes gene_type:complete
LVISRARWEILWVCWKPEKILVIHINIQKGLQFMAKRLVKDMIEKSLKQREQLEGYLRDKYSTVDNFQKLFDKKEKKDE